MRIVLGPESELFAGIVSSAMKLRSVTMVIPTLAVHAMRIAPQWGRVLRAVMEKYAPNSKNAMTAIPIVAEHAIPIAPEMGAGQLVAMANYVLS